MQQVLVTMSMAAVALQGGYSLRVELNHPDGFYKVGEQAVCTATLLKDGQPAVGGTFRCSVKEEGKVVKTKAFEAAGRPVTVEGTMNRPGWLYFGFEVLDEGGRPQKGPGFFKHHAKPSIVGEIGAMFDPDKVRAFPARPADFEAYWAGCRALLDAVVLKADLTRLPVPKELEDRVECFAIEVTCPGKHPVRGYLAVPKGARPKSLPAIVDYQSMYWGDARKDLAIDRAARQGTLALCTSWHALPTGHDRKYYERIAKTWYQPWEGDDDRDTWFWHDFFYRVMRALDFIKSRPEWNGEDLVVSGGSLGGIQTIAAAALDPQVTLAVVSVPGFCDFQGFKAGRDYAPNGYRSPEGLERLKSNEKIQSMVAYHDAVNFAPMIKCDVYVCTGFTDELCSPSTVYAFYNNLTAARSRTMTTDPRTGHYGTTPNVKGRRRLEELFHSIQVNRHAND